MSVAELGQDGKLTPYPDAEWNGFRAAAPDKAAQRFVCVPERHLRSAGQPLGARPGGARAGASR